MSARFVGTPARSDGHGTPAHYDDENPVYFDGDGTPAHFDGSCSQNQFMDSCRRTPSLDPATLALICRSLACPFFTPLVPLPPASLPLPPCTHTRTPMHRACRRAAASE